MGQQPQAALSVRDSRGVEASGLCPAVEALLSIDERAKECK
jgi:hypothetical protein